MLLSSAAAGFVTSAGLIIAIGAQNAFVLRQGVQRSHVGLVVAVCMASDMALIVCGVAGMGALVLAWPQLLQGLRLAVRLFWPVMACWPRTGRTHQIRVHMSYIGHPLAGDTLYGGSDILLRRHALHCGILAFAHPLTGEPLRVECPLPEDMAALARQEKLLTGWQLHSLPCGADPT